MKRAQELLITGLKPITQISMELGFCSSQHFATLFKQHTGVTPGAFRRGDSEPQKNCNSLSDNQS
jgi:AraC-like DNA-binding protein